MRYQLTADRNRYLEEIRPHLKESSYKDKARKLRLICEKLNELYAQGRVSTNNARRFTMDDVIEYVALRRSSGIAESTISKEVGLLDRFLRRFDNDAVREFRDRGGVLRPHSYTGRKKPMDNGTIDRVYELARSTSDWRVMLGCTVVVTVVACGLRVQEARMLYVDGVSFGFDAPSVHVEHVKGEGTWGDPRNVPIFDGTEDIFRKYLAMRAEYLRGIGIESRAMFATSSGSEFYAQQSFCRLKEPVEEILGVRIELRSGRRAFGQRRIDEGNQISDVSYAMGHNSTKTTEQYYARVREDDVNARMLGRQRELRARS